MPKSLHFPRFEQALVYAARLHAGQHRKGSDIPYLAHLLAVTALVLEDGGSEDEAIAALLHDAVEDQGGPETLDEIRARFGHEVAKIVHACTDAFDRPKPPWRERKQEHLERLKQASPGVYRVVLADKLHNARAILRDLRAEGDAAWRKFKGGRDGTLWHLRATHDLLRRNHQSPLLGELERVIQEIEALAGG